MSRAWADNSNDVSHLTISQLSVLKKIPVVVVVWYRVIIASALSQRKRVERESERELDNTVHESVSEKAIYPLFLIFTGFCFFYNTIYTLHPYIQILLRVGLRPHVQNKWIPKTMHNCNNAHFQYSTYIDGPQYLSYHFCWETRKQMKLFKFIHKHKWTIFLDVYKIWMSVRQRDVVFSSILNQH